MGAMKEKDIEQQNAERLATAGPPLSVRATAMYLPAKKLTLQPKEIRLARVLMMIGVETLGIQQAFRGQGQRRSIPIAMLRRQAALLGIMATEDWPTEGIDTDAFLTKFNI